MKNITKKELKKIAAKYGRSAEELEEPLARIAGITEIQSGDGDDLIDMTSQQFAYIGEGMTM